MEDDSAASDAPLDLAAQARMAALRRAMFRVTSEPLRIGRFVVGETLGSGGMGIVFAAHDPQLDRQIALKVVRTDANATRSREVRMLREARSMARLSHPNVVQVYEIGDWEGQVFIAMEMVDGRTLAAWLAAPGRSWREIVAMFVAAGRGLAAAHAAGVVHRDFKPENVLVGADGRARVTDFGLARGDLAEVDPDAPTSAGARDEPGRQTSSGALAGTPAYMAPELFLGRRASVASDQFSFCVALYHALHGVRPFTGDDREALVRAMLAGERQEPPRSRIPRRVHRALVRGLSTAPEERFPDMNALLAAIERRSASPWLLRTAGAAALVAAALGVAAYVERSTGPTCAPSLLRFADDNTHTPYRVPDGCTQIRVKVWGGGGGGALNAGGGGGYAEAMLRVTPGQELVIAVGGGGGHWALGHPPSDTGGSIGGTGEWAGATSGGFSGVRDVGGWLLIAGGGGGAGTHGRGGGGGGYRGQDGEFASSQGQGGSQGAGGAGGRAPYGGEPGMPGISERGGVGGAGGEGIGGGAGGGGWFGGGGGGGDGRSFAAGGRFSGGGGGGSGFVHPDRALPGTIRLETASWSDIPNADEAGDAGRGGDPRVPSDVWFRKDMLREATSGRPGLVIVATGES